MPDPIIVVDHLVKRYRTSEENAVDDISFEVGRGEFFALLGPNGAGKTTTLSILTTTLTPTSGTVHIAGYDVERQAANVRQHVGIIFQSPSLDLNLTAEENVRLGVALYGLHTFMPSYALMSKAYRDQLQRLAEVLDIHGDLFKPLRTFSGGMKRKLEIVRSLMHQPEVLFLDEPTIGLDPSSRRDVWEYLAEVRRQNRMTVVLTTHYLEEAESADRICMLNHGRVVAYGTPDDITSALLDHYLLVDAEDRPALAAELARLGAKATTAEGATGPFKVAVDERSAHGLLKAIDTPLTVLQTHMPSLEDAYLEILQNSAASGDDKAMSWRGDKANPNA